MTDAMTDRIAIRVNIAVMIGQKWSTHPQYHPNQQFHDRERLTRILTRWVARAGRDKVPVLDKSGRRRSG
jgi:hypothetical protein